MPTSPDPAAPDRPPSVDQLARSLADTGLPHPLLVDAARAAVAAGDPERARDEAHRRVRALLQSVVNATGTLLHTNLGRAPLATTTSGRASNVELDLDTGRRGSRTAHAGGLLARAVDAEAAVVVNNCAAAVLLALAALAGGGRGVAVSRGELVEIGGGFRVPDVMAQSGARLVEVGTTNRTRIDDYRRALAEDADLAVLLKVHRSNYTISGFTEDTSVAALAQLTGRTRVGEHFGNAVQNPDVLDAAPYPLGPPVVVDLGSGLLDAACPWLPGGPPAWLRDEPAAKQTLAAGADLVLFSGDKLLGGPQAGVIAGRRDLVQACARHPLYRAFRPGSLVLAALQDVALAYLDRSAGELPFWRMATAPVEALERRARRIAADHPGVEVTACDAVPGGGTLPGVTIPSAGLVVDGDVIDQLRSGTPPVIARVEHGRTVLDLRTVEPEDDHVVAAALSRLQGLG